MNKKYIKFNNYDNINDIVDISLRFDYHLNLNRKCSSCPFFSGEKCHGHGDYHGTCKLIEMLDFDYYKSICYHTSTCLFKGKLFNKNGVIFYE